eukprot:6476565-Amphidinium_carterae.1
MPPKKTRAKAKPKVQQYVRKRPAAAISIDELDEFFGAAGDEPDGRPEFEVAAEEQWPALPMPAAIPEPSPNRLTRRSGLVASPASSRKRASLPSVVPPAETCMTPENTRRAKSPHTPIQDPNT